ncbi:MAG: DNA internalization-related competence protein ComEC/Rec2 [Moorellales bacterium]
MAMRPLVVITIAFAAGIAAGYESSWPLTFLGLVAGLAGVAAAQVYGFSSGGPGKSQRTSAQTTASPQADTGLIADPGPRGPREGAVPPEGGGVSQENTVPPEDGPGEPGKKEEDRVVHRTPRAAFGDTPLAPLVLLALFFFLGAAWARIDVASGQSTLLDDLHTYLYLIGRVAEEPKVYANRTVYVLEAWEARQENWRESLKEKVEVVVYQPREKTQGGATDKALAREEKDKGDNGAGPYLAERGGGIRQAEAATRGPEALPLATGTPRPAAAAAAATGRVRDTAGVAPSVAPTSGANVGGNPIAPAPPYRYGDILQVYGQLKLPPTARNPGEFDYRAYLARRGILTRMSVEPADVRLLGHRPKSLITEWVYEVKARALAVIESGLPSREAGTLTAVLFGDQERLDEQDVEVYRTLGTYHVFAVSGSQVGFVLFLALLLARPAGGAPAVKLALGGGLILFYLALTGFTASVTRAGVMALVGLVALARGERADSYTALAAATLTILLWRPYELLEPGLELSLAATWGIVYLNPFLDEVFSSLPPWRRYLTVTLAAQAGVAWLIAYYFNLFSLAALPANLIVLPAIAAATVLGLALVPLAGLGPGLAVALAWTAGGLLYGLSEVLALLARIKALTLSVPRPPLWTAALYFGALVLAREAWRRRSRINWKRWWPLPAATLMLTFLASCLPLASSGLEVVFLDVGQGDAIYLRTPAGRQVLIDAGGPPPGSQSGYDPGARTVVPFLQRRGVRHLDLVISTHPHGDHLQGLFSVLEKIPASLVLLPPRSYFGASYADFTAFLDGRHLSYREVSRGDRILVDPEVEMVVLSPPAPGDNPGAAPEWTENDYSLVVKCTYKDTSFLLTGDIQAAAMRHLLLAEARGALPANLASTVFKVPHHGSANGLAEDFLAAVNPQAVVISVGEGNNFGHPSPEVIAFWRDRSVPLFRTDTHGAVTFRSNGWQVRPTAYVSGGRELRDTGEELGNSLFRLH